jgi:hypothetical protein
MKQKENKKRIRLILFAFTLFFFISFILLAAAYKILNKSIFYCLVVFYIILIVFSIIKIVKIDIAYKKDKVKDNISSKDLRIYNVIMTILLILFIALNTFRHYIYKSNLNDTQLLVLLGIYIIIMAVLPLLASILLIRKIKIINGITNEKPSL